MTVEILTPILLVIISVLFGMVLRLFNGKIDRNHNAIMNVHKKIDRHVENHAKGEFS